MKITTIDDLPNELLDEIFAYLYPVIPFLKGRLVNTVCRRWNRPFMTTRLEDYGRIPDHVNLQLICPRLSSMTVYSDDLENFKEHASLRELVISCDYIAIAIPSYSSLLSNCPRLTRLTLGTKLSIFFFPRNILALMNICPSLTHLDVSLDIDKNMNDKMTRVLKGRSRDYQGFVNLKNLTITVICSGEDDEEDDDVEDQFDLVNFCSLFQAPFLKYLKIHRDFGSAEEQSKVLSLFPIVGSIEFSDFLVPDDTNTIHGINEHVTDLKISTENEFNLLSIMNQFPNLVSLDSGESEVLFDVMQPTKIRNLRMSRVNPTVELSMFPWLQKLECMVLPQNCNAFIRGLGLNCPELVEVTLVDDQRDDDPIDIDFEDITFPLLTKFKFDGQLAFNESFIRFVTRHPKLESLEFDSGEDKDYQQEVSMPDSETILWPNLATLSLAQFTAENNLSRLHWFLKNSSNLVHLTFDMDDFAISGHEREIVCYCPNLKSLDYSGYLTGPALRRWTRTGNWSNTLKKLRLAIEFKRADLVLLFKFLGTLSCTDDIEVLLMDSLRRQDGFKNVMYKKYLHKHPQEWKSIVTEYCDLLYTWYDLFPFGGRPGELGRISLALKTVFQKVVPYSGAKIAINFETL